MNSTTMTTALHDIDCPICGSPDSQFGTRGYYRKCSECKATFREQYESLAELDDYWQQDFWTPSEIQKRKNREPVFRDAFKLLRRYKPEVGSVLDIGCGIGTFLSVCREGGWEVTGVEPSSVACEVSKNEYGLDLVNDLFSSAMFKGKKFDAVFAAQVLHHLPDPAAFIAEVDKVLADDGVLILRTPNLVALEPSLYLQRLLAREKEFFLGPAIYVFHPKTLSLLFERAGYAECTYVNSRPYLEMPLAPWQPGHSIIDNIRRLSIIALKLGAYRAAEITRVLTNNKAVIGPSIFVVARKG